MRWLAILFLSTCFARSEIVTFINTTPGDAYFYTNVWVCDYQNDTEIYCTNVQEVHYPATNTIAIPASHIVEIINNSFQDIGVFRNGELYTQTFPGLWTSQYIWLSPNQYILTNASPRDIYKHIYPLTLAGPIVLQFIGDGICTYRLTPKEQPIQPGAGVVIPSDATGPVEIILESSADLVNWTPSVPGIYGANTTNRFFRVRAVRQ